MPKWINDGHECIICEVSATNDPSPAHFNTPWNINDRHVAQHNVNIVANNPQHSHPFLLPIAAVGLHNNPAVQVAIRAAPDHLFGPALSKFGLHDCKNVTKASTSGLVSTYSAGDLLPDKKHVQRKLELKDLRPNDEVAFHTLVSLPEKVQTSSAAMFLVEQHDAKGNIVGGVAVILLGDKPPPPPRSQIKASTLTIPATMPYRPYCTNATTGFMTPDGIFMTNLGVQHINVETRNSGSSTLTGLSMYVEGVADPNVTAPIALVSPSNGEALASASFKSIFSADFTKATPGETVVSFIIQQQSGSTSKSIRILKKIFVLGVNFDKANKNFVVSVPQGSLHVHINTIVGPSQLPGPCPPSDGHKCCCGCDDDGGSGGTTGGHYPVLIEKSTLNWIPNPAYPGTHGPLPFNDPWWKVLLAIVAAILAVAGTIVAGLAGDDATTGPEGSFDETSGRVRCCNGVNTNVETGSGVAAALYGAAAAVATVAGLSDDSDLYDRGQDKTPPEAGELTVGELVHFEVTRLDSFALGTNFSGTIEWDYKRTLDSGRTLTYSTKNDFSNIHYLKSYQVNIDSKHSADKHYTHHARDPLIIAAQFTRPNGTLFRGSGLYVFAILISDTGVRLGVELRDDGNGFLGGFPPHDDDDDDDIPRSIPSTKGAILGGDVNPRGSLLSARGVMLEATMAARFDGHRKPNTGSYVGGILTTRKRTGNWYVFVYAQDVNTVLEGTDPRKAAQTIGGMIVTDQFKLGLNGEPCQLDYDAVVTVI